MSERPMSIRWIDCPRCDWPCAVDADYCTSCGLDFDTNLTLLSDDGEVEDEPSYEQDYESDL